MNDNNENKKPDFINEIVKEKKRSKRIIFLRVIFVLALAAAAGFVAAVVFSFALPLFDSESDAQSSDSSKISISYSDEVSSVSEVVSVSPTPEAEIPQENITEIIYETDLSIEEYENLYSLLYAVAADARRSIVDVTGVTSELDYFNESYENEQIGIGLIVAETNSEYYILTYADILEGAGSIRITLGDDAVVTGTLQRSDPNTRLAVVRADKTGIPEDVLSELSVATLSGSYNVSQGELIMVVGNPSGIDDFLAYGTVTSTSNVISYYDNEYSVLTTDVPGGSGGIGIVVDLDGRVVGITSPGTDEIAEHTITALAVSDILGLIEDLSNNVGRAYVGIIGYEVTEQISSYTGIPVGVIVTSIAENSPAMMSGMMEYDIITSIDGEQILSMSQYETLLAELSPGTTIAVSVMRQVTDGYSQVDLTLELGEI